MAISRVQATSVGGLASGTSATLTFGATPTPGNIIVAALAFVGDGATSPDARVVFAGTNMTFYGVTIGVQGTSNTSLCIGVGRVRSSPGSTVQVTAATGGGMAVAGAEYSGVSMNLDREAVTSNTSATPGASTASTTGSANQLWIGAVSHRLTSGTTFSSPTNGFSIVAQAKSSLATTSDRSVCLLEKITSATGAPGFQVTAGASGIWVAELITLEEDASGGITVTNRRDLRYQLRNLR